MESGGLLGISVTLDDRNIVIERVLELEYGEGFESWMPNAVEHAKTYANNLSADVITVLKALGVTDAYEWTIHKNAVDSLLADDEDAASAYGHLIMRHHRTRYGILTWHNDLFVCFQELRTSALNVAAGVMDRMLPNLK